MAIVRDIFNAAMVWGAEFVGRWEFPLLEKTDFIPNNLISFAKRNSADCTNWLHFYGHDYTFVSLWNDWQVKQGQYLKDFLRVAGVILPDYSLYRDMPLAMQIWSVYKSRAIGYWLQSNGIKIIPNIRWGDERTYDFVFDGLPKGGTVAVGSHGCIKLKVDKDYFLRGFNEMLNRIEPETVVVYGRIPRGMDVESLSGKVKIIPLASEFETSHKKGEA
ncbi:MAG: DUF4417 domain-containing protein [Holophagaceae bacterium]|nr:DUF4417 domain-containing protein [Holophagaceae bacterium]